MNDNLVDILSILSFVIGLENLELNITQNDLQEQTADIDKKVNEHINTALSDIHRHLEEQDRKLEILLKGNENETDKETLKND